MTFVYIYIYTSIAKDKEYQNLWKIKRLRNIQQKSRNTTIRCNYNLSMYVL